LPLLCPPLPNPVVILERSEGSPHLSRLNSETSLPSPALLLVIQERSGGTCCCPGPCSVRPHPTTGCHPGAKRRTPVFTSAAPAALTAHRHHHPAPFILTPPSPLLIPGPAQPQPLPSHTPEPHTSHPDLSPPNEPTCGEAGEPSPRAIHASPLSSLSALPQLLFSIRTHPQLAPREQPSPLLHISSANVFCYWFLSLETALIRRSLALTPTQGRSPLSQHRTHPSRFPQKYFSGIPRPNR